MSIFYQRLGSISAGVLVISGSTAQCHLQLILYCKKPFVDNEAAGRPQQDLANILTGWGWSLPDARERLLAVKIPFPIALS